MGQNDLRRRKTVRCPSARSQCPGSTRTRCGGTHRREYPSCLRGVRHATCIYPGATVPSVNELNLEIKDGEFMVLVGPSGSGKSTALRMLAGLEDLERRDLIGGGRVAQAAEGPRHRDGVPELRAVPAHDGRREHGLRAQAARASARKSATRRSARRPALLDLEPYLDRKPKALSGGQRQRVAMGRAIVREPAVFLMDEPLSNLDAKLRVETRANIAELQARLGTTTLYVTHDQVEAMTMGSPRGGAQGGRLPAAGRHSAQPVRHAAQRLRRGLHRLAGDEPAAGRLGARRCPARQHRAAAATEATAAANAPA